MRLVLECNGKINPLGMDFSDLRFFIKADELEIVDSVEFIFFKSLNEVATGECFHKIKTTERYCHLSLPAFACGDELFCRAIAVSGGQEYLSSVCRVEQGLKEAAIFGKWIENADFDGRVAEFSKSFMIDDDILSARLYIVGLGFYSSTINGQKTDEWYFKPLLTDFDDRHRLTRNPWYNEENFANGKKTVCYNTFDVTALTKRGENELRVLLGTGWYFNEDKDYVDPSFTYGKPKLFFELHIKTKAGLIIVKSDESVLVRNTACYSKMYAGDFVDFTVEEENFSKAVLCAPPSGRLVPALAEMDAVIETLTPVQRKQKDNILLLDFGKNHTGGLKLKVRGERGSHLRIKYYEIVNEDGMPNPYTCRWNAYLDGKELIGHIDQEAEYILSGGEDTIEPLFRWNCYRYAEIVLPKNCEILSTQSLFICMDVEKDGEFECCDKTLNNLHQAFVLTQRDNLHCGVPSDCPHREKLPYTGDGQLTAEATMYVFNAENLYRKWLRDIIAAQGKNGWIPYTAPYIGGGGGFWWCNAITVVPVELYKMTGDKTVLEEALEAARGLVNYYNTCHDGDYVIVRTCAGWLLGDWLAPDAIRSSISYINTLAFYSAVLQTRQMASILSNEEIVQEMDGLLSGIKACINNKFFDKAKVQYGNGEQGENLLPFVFGIVPEEYEDKLWKKTVAHYQNTRCFDTGIVLTPVLLELLTARGETKLAFDIMTREEYPSFAWLLKDDTTLCEHWSKYWPKTSRAEGEEEVLTGDVSHCHPMYGSVVAWIYKHMAGLDLSELYNQKIIYAPKFLDCLQQAAASKKTAYGRAAIAYDLRVAKELKIIVPYGLVGEVRLPLQVCKEFSAKRSDGMLVKSCEGQCAYATLTGGEWIVRFDQRKDFLQQIKNKEKRRWD